MCIRDSYNTVKATMGTIFFQENIRRIAQNPPYAAVNNENFQIPGTTAGLDNPISGMLKSFDGKLCSRPIGVDQMCIRDSFHLWQQAKQAVPVHKFLPVQLPKRNKKQ